MECIPHSLAIITMLFVLVLLNLIPEAICFSAHKSSTKSSNHEINVRALGTPKSSEKRRNSNYYTYKSMKRMQIPALLYSVSSRMACKVFRRRPAEIVPPPIISESEISKSPSFSRSRKQPIAIVTGSNTGVGYETAKTLVVDHGFRVIIASRSPEKGKSACLSINALVPTSGRGMALWEGPLDLSNFDSVRSYGARIQANANYETIDVLINNAGVNSAGAVDTNAAATKSGEEGGHQSLDAVFQTNFLGHFLLTNMLLDQCQRVVNLSSVMHHFPLYSKQDDYYGHVESVAFWKDKSLVPSVADFTKAESSQTKRKTYAPSKLASLLFTSELQRRYGSKLTSVAVNPGAVASDIWRNYSPMQQRLFRWLYLTPKQGCQTSVAAAILDFPREEQSETLYLQPYRLPPFRKRKAPFPMFEMLGPYMGYCITTPRLPEDGGIRASQSLFEVCEELTQCQFPQQ